jgi:hypothetical protein
MKNTTCIAAIKAAISMLLPVNWTGIASMKIPLKSKYQKSTDKLKTTSFSSSSTNTFCFFSI